MKIVINKCYGGYGLSESAVMEYAKQKGIELWSVDHGMFWMYYREDPSSFSQKNDYRGASIPEVPSDIYFPEKDIERNDPILVSIVEADPKAASASLADLSVVEIPDGIEWEIGEYDGIEWVDEAHKSWS